MIDVLNSIKRLLKAFIFLTGRQVRGTKGAAVSEGHAGL